jgi:hypothetical protein
VTKLSGPAKEGSSTRVFAPFTLHTVSSHTLEVAEKSSQNLMHAQERSLLLLGESRHQQILEKVDAGQS